MLVRKILKNFYILFILLGITSFSLWYFTPNEKPTYECLSSVILPNEVVSSQKILKNIQKSIPQDIKIALSQNKLTIRTFASSSEGACSLKLEKFIESLTKNVLQNIKDDLEKKLIKTNEDIKNQEAEILNLENEIERLTREEIELVSEYEEKKSIRDNLVGQIDDFELEKKKMLLLYTENHPDVIAIDEEAKILRERLENIAEPEKKYLKVQNDVDLKRSEIVSKRQFLSSLYQKLKDFPELSEISIFRDTTQVSVLGKKIVPKYIIVLGGSLVSSLLLFLFFLVFDRRIYIRRQLDDLKAFKLITTLRKIKRYSKLLGSAFNVNAPEERATFNYIVEFFRGKKIIFVSSPRRREGKTTLAVNLAGFLVSEGKRVLLVDLNLTNPELLRRIPYSKDSVSINEAFQHQNIERKLFNFGSLAVDKRKLQTKINETGLDKLSILFAKKDLKTNLKQYKDILLELSKHHDYVICDSGILDSNLSQVADKDSSVLLVARSGYSSLKDIKKAESILSIEKVVNRGLVFNLCM